MRIGYQMDVFTTLYLHYTISYPATYSFDRKCKEHRANMLLEDCDKNHYIVVVFLIRHEVVFQIY